MKISSIKWSIFPLGNEDQISGDLNISLNLSFGTGYSLASKLAELSEKLFLLIS